MEHEIRKSLEGFTARLRGAVDRELDTLAAELMQSVDRAQKRARAEAEQAMASREAAARAEARQAAEREAAARLERELSQRIAEARAAAALEVQQAIERERSEASALSAAQAGERDARLEAIERLLVSVRRIDAASTLRETLDVLLESAALETPRVAVLLIEGSGVRPFAHRGFDSVPDSGAIAPGGVIEACVLHGQPAYTSDAAALKAPGFAALPDDRAGFAAPLRVGGRTVAVLYADDVAVDGHVETSAPAAWPEALELLARHTSTHLENLTSVRAGVTAAAHTGGPVSTSGVVAPDADAADGTTLDDDAARRYARLLVSEIKLYNEAAVRLGRQFRDLRDRLSDEIDRARRMYHGRVPSSVAARDEYFEQELVHTLADGDPSVLN